MSEPQSWEGSMMSSLLMVATSLGTTMTRATTGTMAEDDHEIQKRAKTPSYEYLIIKGISAWKIIKTVEWMVFQFQ